MIVDLGWNESMRQLHQVQLGHTTFARKYGVAVYIHSLCMVEYVFGHGTLEKDDGNENEPEYPYPRL